MKKEKAKRKGKVAGLTPEKAREIWEAHRRLGETEIYEIHSISQFCHGKNNEYLPFGGLGYVWYGFIVPYEMAFAVEDKKNKTVEIVNTMNSKYDGTYEIEDKRFRQANLNNTGLENVLTFRAKKEGIPFEIITNDTERGGHYRNHVNIELYLHTKIKC